MDDVNPYQSPEIIAEPVSERSRAQQQLAPVSLGIMIGAGIHFPPAVFMCCVLTLQTVLFLRDPYFTPQQTWESGTSAVLALIASVLSSCAFYGAWQMRRLQSRNWAIAACLLAMVPNSVFCVSLFLGIWGLRILLRPSVRAAFDANKKT